MIPRILTALHDAINSVPTSTEPPALYPAVRSQAIGKTAAMKAAAISGALAVPPGPAGLLTLIPDLLLIWRIQGQMVADVAGAYGKRVHLTPEGMMYCLFKHAAAQAVRSVVVVGGGRLLIRRATPELLGKAIERVGVSLTERLATKAVSRWLPVVGAVGVGAYAYYDTKRISQTARETFASDVTLDN